MVGHSLVCRNGAVQVGFLASSQFIQRCVQMPTCLTTHTSGVLRAHFHGGLSLRPLCLLAGLGTAPPPTPVMPGLAT